MTQNGIKDIEDVTAETLKTQKGFDSFFRTNYAMFVSFARKYYQEALYPYILH